MSADAVVTAIRDFGERTARDTCAREEATGRKVRPFPHCSYHCPLSGQKLSHAALQTVFEAV